MKATLTERILFVGFLLSFSVSCSDQHDDPSRTVQEYKASGMPDPGRKWSMEDYSEARNVLVRIKWENPCELPVKGSEKSGLLFDHMVSLDYLSYLEDTTLSLNEKAERISDFARVYDYWTDVYAVPMLKQNPYEREVLDLRIFNLRVMEAMVNLMHEINQSDHPADVALQYGHRSILENYLTSLHTTLTAQESHSELFQRDHERVADSIYASVMRNKAWMDTHALSEVKRSLHRVSERSPSNYIRNKYITLEKSLMPSQKTVSE